MKKVFIVIMILILSPLFAQTLEYKIQLGIYSDIKNAKSIINRFPNDSTTMETKKSKNATRYYVFIINFSSLSEAKNRLSEVNKSVKNAFILHSRVKKAEQVPIKEEVELKPLEKKDEIEIKDTNITKQEKIVKNSISKPLKQVKIGITLKEALIIALNRSNKIQSAREKVIQAKRKLDEKNARYKPKITLYTTGGHTYHHIKGDGGLEQDYPNGSAELSLTQNLYSGGKVSNDVKKEKENLKIATYKFRSLIEEEIINIIDSYLSIIYEKKSIQTNRKNMKDLQKILEIVTIKEKNGASSKGDLNYIKSNVENATSALVQAESKYQNAISYYEYFVGKIDGGNFPIQEEFDFVLDDKNITISKMKKHNAKIQKTKAEIMAQKYGFEAKKAPFKPNLDLILNAKQKRTKSENEPHEDKANVALSLSYNLYNGGRDKAVLLGAKSKIAELKYKLIDLEESIHFNTVQMFDNLISVNDSLKHIKNEVDANKKVTGSYWSAFKYGEQDIQALLLAQRALNRSQLDEIKERKNYALSYFKLSAQTGEIFAKIGLADFVNPDKILQDAGVNILY